MPPVRQDLGSVPLLCSWGRFIPEHGGTASPAFPMCNENTLGAVRKVKMKQVVMMGCVALLGAAVLGCKTKTIPYDYTVEDDDTIRVEDRFVVSDDVSRLKISVIPKNRSETQPFKTDKVLSAKMVQGISRNAYFEVATREDLVNIEIEASNSGVESKEGVVPSELIVVIESEIKNYLGGMTQYERRQLEVYIESAKRQKAWDQVVKAQDRMKAGGQKAVDDPAKAFGVEMFVKCSAYDVASKRLYVSDVSTVSKISDTRGRVDAAIDEIADEVSRTFVAKLAERVAPAMKTDSLIEETRDNGKLVTVDITALQRDFKLKEKAVIYTHVQGRKGARRREIAEGTVEKIEDESVWVLITQEFGYGQPHIGHCADFPTLP